MDRFTHIDNPTALPGCCVFCGKATDPNGFVDTQCELEYHGALQVCYSCTKAMHDAFGFDAIARQVINEDAVANVHHLVEVINSFREQIQDVFENLITHVSGLDRSFVRSYEVLAQAAGAREAAIIAANERTLEQIGLDELGLDSDKL